MAFASPSVRGQAIPRWNYVRALERNVYSAHADFWNTWDQAALQALVVRCFHGKRDCGHFKGITPGRTP